jgi:hypothetical protein
MQGHRGVQRVSTVLEDVIKRADDPYAALPDGIKASYSRDEYMWLSDHEKATLVQRETEPDA